MRFHCIHINKKYGIHINKKVAKGSKTPTWRALQGLSTETVYLCHSANAEDTILAGGSAASPKAPPLRFFVESNATDHQEVSSFFSDKNPKNPSLVDFERATWSLEVVSPANRLP